MHSVQRKLISHLVLRLLREGTTFRWISKSYSASHRSNESLCPQAVHRFTALMLAPPLIFRRSGTCAAHVQPGISCEVGSFTTVVLLKLVMFVSCFASPIQDTSGTGERVDPPVCMQQTSSTPCSTSSKAAKAPFYTSRFPIISLHESNSIFTESVPAAVAMSQHTRSNCSAGKPGHRQSTSPVSQRTLYNKNRVCSALFNTPLQFSLWWCLCYFFNSTRNTCLGQGHLQNISEPPIEVTNYSVCLATVLHSCLKERLQVVSHAVALA